MVSVMKLHYDEHLEGAREQPISNTRQAVAERLRMRVRTERILTKTLECPTRRAAQSRMRRTATG